MDGRGKSWIVKESPGKAYGKYERQLKDHLGGETFRTSRNLIEPYLSPFIAAPRRSAGELYPAGEELCMDLSFSTCQPNGRWRKLDTGSLKVCAIGSPFARHVVVIHQERDGSSFFSARALPRGINFHSFRKYVAISDKRRDDTITYIRRVMTYY